MKIKPVGLDIGTISMKALWLSGEGNPYGLNAAITIPTPPKGMLSESVLDQEEMAKTMQQMFVEAKINQQAVNVSLPENQVYTRVIDMPVLSEKELSSAIYWEAEQYIPLQLEEVTLDWKILQKPQTITEGSRMSVLLVGAPTILIDKYQKILTTAGLSINAIDTEILATVRALVTPEEEGKPNPFPTTIIVHIGAVSTAFAIIKAGTIIFTYSLATGGIALNRAIASDFGFSMAQAEAYKNVYGLGKDVVGGKIGQATMPVLMSIVTEIKKAVAFYNEKYVNENKPIQQIILSGGTAKLPGIDLFFAQYCGIETVIADPLRLLPKEGLAKEMLDNSPDYSVVVGLAMRDYE